MKQTSCDSCYRAEDSDACYCWILELTRTLSVIGIVGAIVYAIVGHLL